MIGRLNISRTMPLSLQQRIEAEMKAQAQLIVEQQRLQQHIQQQQQQMAMQRQRQLHAFQQRQRQPQDGEQMQMLPETERQGVRELRQQQQVQHAMRSTMQRMEERHDEQMQQLWAREVLIAQLRQQPVAPSPPEQLQGLEAPSSPPNEPANSKGEEGAEEVFLPSADLLSVDWEALGGEGEGADKGVGEGGSEIGGEVEDVSPTFVVLDAMAVETTPAGGDATPATDNDVVPERRAQLIARGESLTPVAICVACDVPDDADVDRVMTPEAPVAQAGQQADVTTAVGTVAEGSAVEGATAEDAVAESAVVEGAAPAGAVITPQPTAPQQTAPQRHGGAHEGKERLEVVVPVGCVPGQQVRVQAPCGLVVVTQRVYIDCVVHQYATQTCNMYCGAGASCSGRLSVLE